MTLKTAREKFEELMTEFGIKPEVQQMSAFKHGPRSDNVALGLEAGSGGVVGYSGFSCWFEFTRDGSFVRVSVGES